MDLQAPTTLLTAWVLVPALVVAASAGIGYGVGLVSGIDLGALTIPAGYLAGMAVATILYFAGIAGVPTVVVLVLLAAAGPVYARRSGRGPRLPPRGERGGLVWGALAGLGGYAAALAPIAGSGRSGVLGYVFNDDSAVHIALVELISSGVTGPDDVGHDSYHHATQLLDEGYPIGSYAWPVFGRLLGGIDAFHIWSPLSAVALAMLALIAFAMLRRLGAPSVYAAVAAVVVPCGHLVYAYHTQGGMKEVIMPVAVYGTAGLLALALQSGAGGRAFIPAALAAAAAVADLGYAGAAWIGPMGLAAGGVVVSRYVRGVRKVNPRRLLIFAVAAVALILPAGLSSFRFYRNFESEFIDPAEVGNLFDAISLWQTLNVWLTGDYRFKPTEHPGFTYTALGIALALAIAGLVHALLRREAGLLLALLAGIAGSWLISRRTSIYFDAKTYVVLAPGLGIATAAGVLLLWRRGRVLRAAGLAAAATVAVGVVWSAALIYAQVWFTPETRLGELRTIAERFDGRAKVTLVSDREQYSAELMREIGPWDDWGYRQPQRGFRFHVNAPPPPGRAPDLDDFDLDHIEDFAYVVERKSPGGSRAPANYRPVFETVHYRVWERTGPAPRAHEPFGSDGQVGSAEVACRGEVPRSAGLRGLAGRARRLGAPLIASVHTDRPVTVIKPENWGGLDFKRAVPAPGTVAGRGGGAAARARVPQGRYELWMLGSFGAGVRLSARLPGQARATDVGDVFNDLGSPGWQRFGSAEVGPRTVILAGGLSRSRLLAGGNHFNIAGDVKLIREGAATRLERVEARDMGRLCGRNVDWVELPPA